MSNIRPVGIKADKQRRTLTINWSDTSSSIYPYAGLRAVCPCVECKGGHGNMGTPPDPRIVRDTPDSGITIEGIAQMGSYAIQINWSDGHNTGIFTWQMLRQADPAKA